MVFISAIVFTALVPFSVELEKALNVKGLARYVRRRQLDSATTNICAAREEGPVCVGK